MREENKKSNSEEIPEDGIVLMLFMFRGSYLSQKLGHEVINLFEADDGNHYIYVPPYGYVTNMDKIHTILLARHIGNSQIEILAKAKVKQAFLKNNDSRNKNRVPENLNNIKERQSKLCERISYGGKSIIDIFQFNKPGDRQHILVSFKVTDFRFSKRDINKPIIISYSKENTEDDLNMEGNMPCQSLKTYFSKKKGKKDEEKIFNEHNFDKIKQIIENKDFWGAEAKPVNKDEKPKNEIQYFIKVIGKEDDEIAFSNLLYYYFSKRNILNKFICQVIKKVDGRVQEVDSSYDIYRERKHTDSLIEDDNQIIVIENKIKADFHNDQLSRYYKSAKEIAEKRGDNPKIVCFVFVPDYNKECREQTMREKGETNFRIVTYSKIYNFFMEMKKDSDVDQEYMEDFCKALKRHAQPGCPDDLHDENLYTFLKTIHQS